MRAAILLLLLAAGANAAGFRAILSPFMTQADAKTSCIAQGGELAKLSASNIEDVSDLFAGAGDGSYGTSTLPEEGHGAWVGAEDRATEGQFVWQDGSSASDAPWFSGEPNQFEGSNEDCVATTKWFSQSWELYDIQCESMLRFVCQIDSLTANEIATVTSKEATTASLVVAGTDPATTTPDETDQTCDDSKCASSVGDDCCTSKNPDDETRACKDGYTVVMTQDSCYYGLGWTMKCCMGDEDVEELPAPVADVTEEEGGVTCDARKCSSSIGNDCCAGEDEAKSCRDGYYLWDTDESCAFRGGRTFKCCDGGQPLAVGAIIGITAGVLIIVGIITSIVLCCCFCNQTQQPAVVFVPGPAYAPTAPVLAQQQGEVSIPVATAYPVAPNTPVESFKPPQGAGDDGVLKKIADLKTLLDSGALSDAEFEAAKATLLARM